MRYVFALHDEPTKVRVILKELRKHSAGTFSRVRTTILIKSESEDLRMEARMFCLGFAIAKGWRSRWVR